MAGRCGITGIRAAIADYLAVRRALGYKLADHGWLLAELRRRSPEDRDAGTITTEFALAWATRPGNALPSWWAAPRRARACPADHGTGSRSQILIEARSMVPRNV